MKVEIGGIVLWVTMLVFLFWNTPDNWDKFDYMIDTHYQQMRIDTLGCITDTECEQL